MQVDLCISFMAELLLRGSTVETLSCCPGHCGEEGDGIALSCVWHLLSLHSTLSNIGNIYLGNITSDPPGKCPVCPARWPVQRWLWFQSDSVTVLSVSCTHQNTNYRASYRLTPPLVISSWKPQNEKSLYSLVGETEGEQIRWCQRDEQRSRGDTRRGPAPQPQTVQLYFRKMRATICDTFFIQSLIRLTVNVSTKHHIATV